MRPRAPRSEAGPDATRVAICITGLEVGGAETLLAELLSLAPSDIHVKVFSLIDGGPIAERITSMGIEVVGLHMLVGRPSLYALMSLTAQLREYRPDVVHTWLYHADLLGGLAAKMAGVRHVVWHLHNSDLSPQRVRRMTRLVVRVLAILSWWIPDVILSCSEKSLSVHAARGFNARRIVVIPNGVDTRRFAPSPSARPSVREEFGVPDDGPLIGLVARLDSQKNHRGFFEAARVFFERGGDAHFLLAGRGVTPDGWQLAGWRDATGRPERIFLAGPRDDVARLMAAFDVATSSSLGEAFPMVLVEAMACGVPCVATDVGDSRLIVSDTGIVVPSGDAEALADAWSTMLDMPAENRRELGKQARARVERKFRIEDMAERVWGIYRELADG